MGTRNSEQDQQGVTWQTVGLRLGQGGLDLRDEADGSTLVKLLNARFRDDRTLERRNGYSGVRLRDAGDYPIFRDVTDNPVSSPITPVGWIYGHGQLISSTNSLASQDTHIPEPGVGSGVFSFGDTDVAWTGDRLLMVRNDGNPALGASGLWNYYSSTPLSYGIPAYIPVQTDSTAPDAARAEYPETCLSDTYRVIAAPNGQQVEVWITDRDSGALVNHGLLGAAGSGVPVDVRALVSGSSIVVLWRFAAGGFVMFAVWNGLDWTVSQIADAETNAYDVAPVGQGFYLFWRTGANLKAGCFIGATSVNTPFTFGSTLTVTGGTPNGAVAIAVSRTGDIGLVWSAADGLQCKVYDPSLTSGNQARIDTGITWTGGLTAAFRILGTRATSKVPLVVHAGDATANKVQVWEFLNNSPGVVNRSDARYNSRLASKSFVVGNEVFCWLRSVNASTLYLVAGARGLNVCGYADREVAATRTITDTVGALSMVAADPRDPFTFTWARPYVTGQEYVRPGNVRVGDTNFLPQLSTAQYGRGVYVAASATRVFDGMELGHAGFQDYPKVQDTVVQNTGGAMTVGGIYRALVIAVRYTKQGERFESPGIVSAAQTLTASNTKVTWTVQTVPSTDHQDVTLEFYRTTNNGAAFYLEGTVANRLDADTVTFDSTLSDLALAAKTGYSGRNLIPGAIVTTQTFGPLGSAVVKVVGDRLWTCGGQVPPGHAQYSLLKSPNAGAGFDNTDPTEEVDTTGGDIVSIAELAGGVVFFQRDRIQVLNDNGPDNFGNGSFSAPQLVLADGATTHFGTASTQAGVVYWGQNGPRLLDRSFAVQNISLPVQRLTGTMTPVGVQVDLARQEVVWFTEDGTGVLWNYLGGSRWAQWSGVPIAGCSQSALIAIDGRVLYDTPDVGDDGAPFEFTGKTGELRPEQVLGGATDIHGVGIVGAHLGPHTVRLRVYYNGSPLWTDQWVWQPETGTGLTAGTAIAGLTAAQVDALNWIDQSGGYATHKRTSRGQCRSFAVEWSDGGSSGPTFIPYELTMELGGRGGFGRVAPNTFSRS